MQQNPAAPEKKPGVIVTKYGDEIVTEERQRIRILVRELNAGREGFTIPELQERLGFATYAGAKKFAKNISKNNPELFRYESPTITLPAHIIFKKQKF
ncbi:hypothetical protein MsAg5_10270 [Methanosarcinaceae archaeon Ag5]|uniref:Uncharacterized protein n=1 Tax=Methanolapillus africanus TaxID=3028297 RepID=A0AAE4MJL5_9EURY|nr:hypothetical protein [Methanosarcinaceae archaeon Ag5]